MVTPVSNLMNRVKVVKSTNYNIHFNNVSYLHEKMNTYGDIRFLLKCKSSISDLSSKLFSKLCVWFIDN